VEFVKIEAEKIIPMAFVGSVKSFMKNAMDG
jgi:hypothetical protein